MLCSFKEEDIISEWDFKIDTVKAAPAAVPVATSTNRKTTKRQLLDNTGQQQLKRSSIHSDITVSSATEQLIKRSSTITKEASGETSSIDESESSAVTEEVVMDLSSKQPAAEVDKISFVDIINGF